MDVPKRSKIENEERDVAEAEQPRGGRMAVGIGSRIQWSNDEIIKIAQDAEALGYDTICVAESWGRDQVTILAMLAMHTSRVKLATGITGTWARSPGCMGQTAISLDTLSNGRFVVGVGSGNPLPVQHWHGATFTKPLTRMREFIEVMRQVWSGQPLQYDGEFYHPGGRYPAAFKGPRDHIPVYVASIGTKAIEMTGELADGWMPVHVDVENFQVLKQHLDAGARRAGRDPSLIDISAGAQTCVDDDEERARIQVKNRLGWYIGRGYRYRDLMARYGFADEAERIRLAWDSGGLEAATRAVTDQMVDRLGIAGTPEQCRRQIQRYYAAGIHQVQISLQENVTLESARRTIEALAPVRR